VGFDYTSILRECHNYFIYFKYMLKIGIELDTKIKKITKRDELSYE
jgi:hypothetical protein